MAARESLFPTRQGGAGRVGWLAMEAMALCWVCLRSSVFLVVVFLQGRLSFP